MEARLELPKCIMYVSCKKLYRVEVKNVYLGSFKRFPDAIKARNKERLRLTIKACKNVQKRYHKEND